MQKGVGFLQHRGIDFTHFLIHLLSFFTWLVTQTIIPEDKH